MEKGIGRGRNPEITGGGLLRSIGGWGVLKSMRRMSIHIKGDERILGDSDFVEKVLTQASEQMERRYRLKAEGWTLTKITERVAEIFGIEKDQVVVAGKQPDRVRARSVLAYWAIRDLGLTATEVGKYLGLSKSAVSRAATSPFFLQGNYKKNERVGQDSQLRPQFHERLNYILFGYPNN